MSRYQDTFWCDGCGIEMQWVPIVQDTLIYCCRDCSLGHQCNCEEFEEEFPTAEKQNKFPVNSSI